MKRNNKKGFTIVELVIVIAVIGILAAVLIPTFSNAIAQANASAELQEARNAYTKYISEGDHLVKLGDKTWYVKVVDGNNTVYYGENTTTGEFEKLSGVTPTAENVVININGEHDAHGTADANGNCPLCGDAISNN